jgi:hypothetical protein
VAKSWIRACLTNHPHCQKFQRNTVSPYEMPTRILEVGENSIRLRCDMTNETFDYLVLSHMWGEDHGQQLLLEESRVEEFQKDIPMHELATSATFREAIRATRVLGCRYIWIDSLCNTRNATGIAKRLGWRSYTATLYVTSHVFSHPTMTNNPQREKTHVLGIRVYCAPQQLHGRVYTSST